MIEQEQFNRLYAKEQTSLIAIPEDVESVLQEQEIKKIISEEDDIRLSSDKLKTKISVCLKKKIPQKPLHVLKIRKRIHKVTKKESFIIERSQPVKALYDYQEMCDFVSSQGGDIIKSESKFNIDRDELLNFVRGKLQERISNGPHAKEDQQANQLYKKLIKPEYFLKNFNLVPPKCDFFVNKTKTKDEKQFNNSLNINFQDPLPLLSVQVPKNIQESPLFATIQQYLAKRPCWLKNTLLYVLKQEGNSNFTVNQLKNILKYLCYTFKNGPWKHTFCMFGYDPRKTYKSVIYQNVSLKLKKKEAEDYEQEIEEEIYDPTFGDISTRCMRAYQIGDIYLQEVKEIINGKLISEEGECTKEHGWLSQNEHNHILRVMKEHKDKKNK